MAGVLEQHQSLASLNLRGNLFSDEGAAAFATLLGNSSALNSLDLGSNGIEVKGAEALANALLKNTSLQSLDLFGNQIGSDGVQAFVEPLQQRPQLVLLKLGQNNIGDQGVIVLSEMLRKKTCPSTLDLCLNNISDVGMQVFLEAIEPRGPLTVLNLGSNKLTHRSTQALASLLKKNISLTHLIYSFNKVDDAGAVAFAEALKENTSLVELNLFHNAISTNGAVALAEALKDNVSLISLNIRGSNIYDAGAKAFLAALRQNTTLTELEISDWGVEEKTLTEIRAYLARNKSIEEQMKKARDTLRVFSQSRAEHTEESLTCLQEAEALAAQANTLCNNISLPVYTFRIQVTLHRMDLLGELLAETNDDTKIKKYSDHLQRCFSAIEDLLLEAMPLSSNKPLGVLPFRFFAPGKPSITEKLSKLVETPSVLTLKGHYAYSLLRKLQWAALKPEDIKATYQEILQLMSMRECQASGDVLANITTQFEGFLLSVAEGYSKDDAREYLTALLKNTPHQHSFFNILCGSLAHAILNNVTNEESDEAKVERLTQVLVLLIASGSTSDIYMAGPLFAEVAKQLKPDETKTLALNESFSDIRKKLGEDIREIICEAVWHKVSPHHKALDLPETIECYRALLSLPPKQPNVSMLSVTCRM